MSALPSGYRIEEVDRSADVVLRNLFEHYLHDMAEWFLFDSHEDGAYQYPTETIWENGCRAYLLYAGKIPTGFALIGTADTHLERVDVHDMHEFFVVRRHRGHGVGRSFTTDVWAAHPGEWLVRALQANEPAIPFWRSAISTYTDGRFGEETRTVDGRPWSYFTFQSNP
jgi:predicted acetyltransferase